MMIGDVETLKWYAKIAGDADDELLELLLKAQTGLFQKLTNGRQFVRSEAPEAKTFSTQGADVIQVPDLASVDDVTLDGASLGPWSLGGGSGYQLIPPAPHTDFILSGVSRNGRGTGYGDLVITGIWGWDPVPDEVVDAVMTMAARKFRERAASYADTVSDPEGGLLAYYRQLPPSVQAVVDLYRLPSAA